MGNNSAKPQEYLNDFDVVPTEKKEGFCHEGEIDVSIDFYTVQEDDGKKEVQIKIHDPWRRRSELKEKVSIIKRAIIQPMEEEIALLKRMYTGELELEIIFGGNLSGHDQQENQSIPLQNSHEIISIGLSTKLISEHNRQKDITKVPQEPHHYEFVDPSLHNQVQAELIAMRQSLERNKGWKLYYAYHLERFRQLHSIIVKEYQFKVEELDTKRSEVEKSMRFILKDYISTGDVLNDCCRNITQLKQEKEELDKTLNRSSLVNRRHLETLKNSRDTKTIKLQNRLKKRDYKVIEDQVVKIEREQVLEESKVEEFCLRLNDKLNATTKDLGEMAAENKILRQQETKLRARLKEEVATSESYLQPLNESRLENELLKENFARFRNQMSKEAECTTALRSMFQAEIKEATALTEIQSIELQQLERDVRFWREKATLPELEFGSKIDLHSPTTALAEANMHHAHPPPWSEDQQLSQDHFDQLWKSSFEPELQQQDGRKKGTNSVTSPEVHQ